MKRKVFIIAQVVILVFGLVMAGNWAGTVTRNLALLGGSAASPVSASTLTIEPKAPLAPLTPAGNGFTYQGRLKFGGTPANGPYDFTFKLYDDPSAGSQVGSTITATVVLTDGLLTTTLDFGAGAFNGDGRWLEIASRPSGAGGYTTLSPRQPITPAPYALFALRTQPYKNVVSVAQSGGQFTSITAALNSLTDNSAINRYLIRIGPGTYTETVTMKPYVDVEGAGEKSTRITFTGS